MEFELLKSVILDSKCEFLISTKACKTISPERDSRYDGIDYLMSLPFDHELGSIFEDSELSNLSRYDVIPQVIMS
jgi:hypothetical protein